MSRSKTFESIQEFVSQLWSVFGDPNKNTPLSLYHKIVVENVKNTNKNGVKKVINGFRVFLDDNQRFVFENRLKDMEKDTKIQYGTNGTVFIDIQRFISRSDDSILNAIRSHLLTIITLIDPNPENLKFLKEQRGNEFDLSKLNINTDTKEGQFVENILEDMSETMKNIDTTNPQAAMMAMMARIPNALNNLGGKDIDPRVFTNMVRGLLDTLDENQENSVNIDEVD